MIDSINRIAGNMKAFALVALAWIFVCPALRADPLSLPPEIGFSVLPPPPSDDSPTGLADLHVLLYVQANRTPEQVEFAQKMASPSVFEMGREIFGPWFTRENLPKTAEILREMTKATDVVKENAKKNWMRPRPYTRSDLIVPVVKRPDDAGSYPSGHSYGIAVSFYVLEAAYPEHSQRFEEMIRRVMWGRIVGGAHFPSDTEAGRLLAKHVVTQMLANSELPDAIETIRNEINAFIHR